MKYPLNSKYKAKVVLNSLSTLTHNTVNDYLNNVSRHVLAAYYSSKSHTKQSAKNIVDLDDAELKIKTPEEIQTAKVILTKLNNQMIPYVLSMSDFLTNIAATHSTATAAKTFIKYEKIMKETISQISSKNPLNLKNSKSIPPKIDKTLLGTETEKPKIEIPVPNKSSPKEFEQKIWIIQDTLHTEEKIVKLCDSITKASSSLIKTILLNDLFTVLYDNPEYRYVVFRKRKLMVNQLIKMSAIAREHKDTKLVGTINEVLALLGYIDQTKIKHRGINILSLDGGGSKGFVTIEILKNIEKQCGGKPIHEIFDYICGVSTGAVLASLLGILKMPLDEVEKLYSQFTQDLFKRNVTTGLGNLIKSHSYYDTQMWEVKLQENLSHMKLINSSRDSNACKIGIVSNVTTPDQMKVFLFRNYNLPTWAQSHYDGTCRNKIWEAVRASSAAPGYYEDFKIDGYVFHDGGLLANNPTAIAIHEAKQIWPHIENNCVVSIGNGRFKPAGYASSKAQSISLKQKLTRIVSGISDPEIVHTILLDTMPQSSYFRFNPYLTEEFNLDESRPEKWKMMQHETNMYMRRNDYKLKMLSKQLLRPKSKLKKLQNYLIHKKLNCSLKSYI